MFGCGSISVFFVTLQKLRGKQVLMSFLVKKNNLYSVGMSHVHRTRPEKCSFKLFRDKMSGLFVMSEWKKRVLCIKINY